MRFTVVLAGILLASIASDLPAKDWRQFRGPGGLGTADAKGLPVTWSSSENIAWSAELPGPGSSSPIVAGDRVYLTSYTGYGLEVGQGDQKELRRHVLCFDRATGEKRWHKELEPKLPEHRYEGEGSYHGYAASTPVADGERLYVFFGRTGVFCFDLDGKQLWHASVGDGTSGWGSGCSPVLHDGLVIVNASVESGSLVALDKLTGEEVWRAKNVRSAWNTPLLIDSPKRPELVVSTESRLMSFSPKDGSPLWNADGVHRYVCPSVVAHDGVVYAIGGGHTSLAVRLGGEGDVTESHTVWREKKGSNVCSPVYHGGHLYWASDSGGYICCQDAATGKTVYEKRLEPRPGTIWSSALLADGRIYFVSQRNGTFVVAAKPEFELISHNVLEDDNSRTNASPAAADGQLFLRTDRRLYCIGAK